MPDAPTPDPRKVDTTNPSGIVENRLDNRSEQDKSRGPTALKPVVRDLRLQGIMRNALTTATAGPPQPPTPLGSHQEGRTEEVVELYRSDDPADEHAPLVLIVDDDQNSREGLAEFLVQQGFRITEASDGAEALQKVEARRPDVVLLDLAIPRVDGWTVARELKRDPRYASVPVIVFSAMDYPDEIQRAVQAGCDAFVTKPCNLSVLIPTIERVLGRGPIDGH
jgi:CheY-like chemotaxis protein